MSNRQLVRSFWNPRVLHFQHFKCIQLRHLSYNQPSSRKRSKNPDDYLKSYSHLAIPLTNKSLLRVSGDEAFIYLQTLLTNDMRYLLNPQNDPEYCRDSVEPNASVYRNQSSLHGYFLSAVGRVLCDLFIYRSNSNWNNQEFLLEVDKNLEKAVKRLLVSYNVSRSVQIERVNDVQLWSILPMHFFLDEAPQSQPLTEIDSDDIKLVPDPRVGHQFFGYRFLSRLGTKSNNPVKDVENYLNFEQAHNEKAKLFLGSLRDYVWHKYSMGIAEGHDDILSGHYFPFELNADLTKSISLTKGNFDRETSVFLYIVPFHPSRFVHFRRRCNQDLFKQNYVEANISCHHRPV